MMKNLRNEEENIIKNTKYLSRLEKETKGIEDIILIDIKDVFEDYYKPAKVNNIWGKKYTEFKSNEKRNKTLSMKNILIKLDHI